MIRNKYITEQEVKESLINSLEKYYIHDKNSILELEFNSEWGGHLYINAQDDVIRVVVSNSEMSICDLLITDIGEVEQLVEEILEFLDDVNYFNEDLENEK